MPNDAYLITLMAVTSVIFVLTVVNYIIKIFRFKFYGSTFLPILFAFVMCYLFSLVLNLYPIKEITATEVVFKDKNIPVSIAVSFFDAIKMFALSFEKQGVIDYFNAGNTLKYFSFFYVGTAIYSLVFASISVVIFTIKTFWAKIKTVWFLTFSRRDVCYIFSDPKVPIAARIGQDLLKKKKSVVMIISRSSQKTQEGTEYKDSLLMKGFNVRTENFTTGICRVIFKRFGRRKRTFVYGIFSNDDLAIELANNFQETVAFNEKKRGSYLYKLLKKELGLSKLKSSLKKSIDEFKKQIKSAAGDNKKVKKFYKKVAKAEKKFPKIDKKILELKKKKLSAYRKFKVFVTYHEADIDLNNNYSQKTNHIINTVSEYDIISTEFILNNPIDLFIDIDKLDEIPEGAMNVTFLGFGKINRPIFEKMASAYQLWGDNIHKVTYSILDRESKKLAEFCNNEYTSVKGENDETPFLYKVQADCNGEDLTEFNTIEEYVKRIANDPSRFTATGFEHFIISVCDTNRDIKIGTYLRKALFKYASPENLSRCRIYVRIANDTLAENFINNNGKSVVFRLTDYNKKYLSEAKESGVKLPEVPIIVFGENALMSAYISTHYENLIKLSIGAQKSYNKSTGKEDEDYINAELDIIKSSKLQLLQNFNAAYNFHIKAKLLGYTLSEEYKISKKGETAFNIEKDINRQVSTCGFPENISNNNNVIKLAQLEHNRWVAASYMLHKFSKWNKKEFIKKNIELDKEKNPKKRRNIAKSGFQTRINETLHVCMLNNACLYELRNYICDQTFKRTSEKNKILQANKLVFDNDITQLKEMLNTLKSIV